MIYMNDCSISVARSCIKLFVYEIFIQIFHTKIILQRKKKLIMVASVCYEFLEL